MNFTVAALLGLTMAQPPAPDYFALNSRNIKLPIEYKKDKRGIAQVQLYVCENGDQVWKQVAAAPPTQEAFVYAAPNDGLYWFHIVIVDMQGKKDPANLTAEPPAQKVLVDTTRPYATFTNARRTGEEVVVEWKVEDRYPDESATKVHFRDPTVPSDPWKEVTLHPTSRNGVKFRCGTSGPVSVRVSVQDFAGNTGEKVQEFTAAGVAPPPNASTSLSPGIGAGPALPAASGVNPPPPPSGVIPPPESVAPPVGPGPLAPAAPPAMPPAAPPVAPPAVGVMSPAAPAIANPYPSTPAVPSAPAYTPPAAPAYTPPAALVPNPGMGSPIASGQGTPGAAVPYSPPPAPPPTAPAVPNNVLAVGTGTASPAPVVEVSRAQVINYPRFDLAYEVEQRGPSGISRVDLWVTRDDGRTWAKWSQHDGRETPVRVALDTRTNTALEGLYGFRLVPVSGAGLSDPAPANGDVPDMRVVVDITPPVVKIFEPVSDPMQRDTLVVQWEATDRNFGEEPIALEWSENPHGPWHPITSAGSDGVVQVTAMGGALARRLPNTGRFPWRVPTGLPPKVYLKVSARDAAGNTTEVVTPGPILVDLSKPRAKITGIGGSTPVPTRP